MLYEYNFNDLDHNAFAQLRYGVFCFNCDWHYFAKHWRHSKIQGLGCAVFVDVRFTGSECEG